MALVLSGERPAAAALSNNPVHFVLRLVAKARRAHAQRQALDYLLGLDNERLDDPGITRKDLFDALDAGPRFTRLLADRRARRTTDWLNP